MQGARGLTPKRRLGLQAIDRQHTLSRKAAALTSSALRTCRAQWCVKCCCIESKCPGICGQAQLFTVISIGRNAASGDVIKATRSNPKEQRGDTGGAPDTRVNVVTVVLDFTPSTSLELISLKPSVTVPSAFLHTRGRVTCSRNTSKKRCLTAARRKGAGRTAPAGCRNKTSCLGGQSTCWRHVA